MNRHETFGQCLQRILTEMNLSASEVARLVGFRSRNSIFRILGDDTGYDVDARFLANLQDAVGDAWPREHWQALQEALEIKRVGFEQYISNKVFFQTLHGPEQEGDYVVLMENMEQKLRSFLRTLLEEGTFEIVMTGDCEAPLARLLAQACAKAGDEGRLTIRHYIDANEHTVVRNFLGVLPLVNKSWYNARLVDCHTCPQEMLALYRVSSIIIIRKDGAGQRCQLTRYDGQHFLGRVEAGTQEPLVDLLDRWRYHLEILKPPSVMQNEAEAFIEYTVNIQQLEKECTILSVKPDIHFNCVPSDVLRPAITEGLQSAGIADGAALRELMVHLEKIHTARYDNMMQKRSATHLVYSLPAMKCFMETGIQTDHFFIQRAYTPQERRAVVKVLLDAMRSNPYFNVHFLKEDTPALRNEITLYKGKGVLMLDAYSNYDLNDDHSEALITQPAFMERFYRFFMDELLQKHVVSRAETVSMLEHLIQM